MVKVQQADISEQDKAVKKGQQPLILELAAMGGSRSHRLPLRAGSKLP